MARNFTVEWADNDSGLLRKQGSFVMRLTTIPYRAGTKSRPTGSYRLMVVMIVLMKYTVRQLLRKVKSCILMECSSVG